MSNSTTTPNTTITFVVKGAIVDQGAITVAESLLAKLFKVDEEQVDSDFDNEGDKTELQKFIAEFAKEREIAPYTAVARLSKDLGISHRTLERWIQKGIPASGNRRNGDAADRLNGMMAYVTEVELLKFKAI